MTLNEISGPRKVDPNRRDRVLQAALRVVSAEGIEGLSYRAVAKAAGVPLGSVTYHFPERDDLLLAAINLTRERSAATRQAILIPAIEEHGVARGVATMIQEFTVSKRNALIADYELYLSARRRPRVKEQVDLWHSIDPVFVENLGPIKAQILQLTITGLFNRAVVSGDMYYVDDVLPLMEEIIGTETRE